MLAFVFFCSRIPSSKDSCHCEPVHWSAIRVNWLVAKWYGFLLKTMFEQSGFIPVDTWFEFGISERFRWCPRRRGMVHVLYIRGCLFCVGFWMKNHCKWITQHMINTNNTNNGDNNNSNSAVMSQTWTGILTQTQEIFSKCVCCFIPIKHFFDTF